MEHLELAHITFLSDTMYEPSNEFMSLNLENLSLDNDTLSLVYLKLIEWDSLESNNIDTFPNDNSLALYLNEIEPSSTNEIY